MGVSTSEGSGTPPNGAQVLRRIPHRNEFFLSELSKLVLLDRKICSVRDNHDEMFPLAIHFFRDSQPFNGATCFDRDGLGFADSRAFPGTCEGFRKMGDL